MKISLPFALLCGSLVWLLVVSNQNARQRAEAQEDPTIVEEQETVEPITVYLASGRSFTARLDPQTDTSELWLRSQRGRAVLSRPIRWKRVTQVRVAGEHISGEELRQIVAKIRQANPALAEEPSETTPQEIVFRGPASTAGSTASEDGFSRPQEGDRTARVRSLAVWAEVANWDADVTADGLIVRIYPLDDRGAPIPARGSLRVDLHGQRTGVVKHPQPFGILGQWTRQVRPEDFGPDGAEYRLPFQRVSPEFDLSLAAHGAVHARLSVPGQGTFEATQSTVRIRPSSPVRDQLQQATGRRFFSGERTGGGPR